VGKKRCQEPFIALLDDDPWFQFVYDARWRQTATYRASHYSGWTIDANS